MNPWHPKTDSAQMEPGSFRDRAARVFYMDSRVLRGLSNEAKEVWRELRQAAFFSKLHQKQTFVATRELGSQEFDLLPLAHRQQWSSVLQHERVPFVSYPYEWCFDMLRDAALVQLEIIREALEDGFILKDATPYNVQFIGSRAVFIDMASFIKWNPGDPWMGYRQFCQLFLYPLMLEAYRNVDFHPWLRGHIDGMDVEQFAQLFGIRDWVRPGVFKHVCLHSKFSQAFSAQTTSVLKEIKDLELGKKILQKNLDSLFNCISKLRWKIAHSTWSDYAEERNYHSEERAEKEAFVSSVAKKVKPYLAWDLGCNTGEFSKLICQDAEHVLALDGDHLAINRFYNELKKDPKNREKILPLVINLSDSSPNLGWRGLERKSIENRGAPQLILALALIHHIVISSNIPMEDFVSWLSQLAADVVIEFVSREDEMVQKLLRNKQDRYDDYSEESFRKNVGHYFEVIQDKKLKRGYRTLFHLRPWKN